MAIAAADRYDKFVTCWWDCEVTIHKSVCGGVADAAGAATVITFTHLEIAKAGFGKVLGRLATLLPCKASLRSGWPRTGTKASPNSFCAAVRNK